ncbi:hemagglutinin repeat-containing protein (plasmid) [Enterobacter sp. JBIWA003]|uniref:hemagglutinin repeat-containing protein n=1 Tax=Enterobacter sp. JBIWA003 TaxID=2831890 RepID=UPI001CBB63C2|nr:hemagglutinin repeat-containing protein [Enterobacter sp. JBIWA003]UAN24920.1 hemagglutinin repeat-containing protein [Enterobacter sp. JBIWA003]
MNKLFYRIVFNKARGMLMVVADITRSHRAGVSPSSGSDSKPGAKLTATLAPLTFGLLLAFAQITPAMAGIVADKSAPGNQQPQVINSASGIPQVDIQAPSAAGVSRNTYSQFDVDKAGAILNNSHKNINTNLAGMVAGNPNLVKGEAKVILNEVNSRDPSKLNGYIEVAGKKAQVVIANPSGISCDGCGFINANRSTLTTGKPQFSNGDLTGYQVKGGNITITGGGLNSDESDYTDIIARSFNVNAAIRARDLKVTTGRNLVDAAHQTITRLTDDGSSKPGMALDVSALGGMYAGKIRLIGTEQGVGVHNAGEIGATAGSVVLTADGRIENNGKISSRADMQISSSGDITNSGKLHSKGQLTLSSDGSLTNSGTMAGSSSLTVHAKMLTSTKESLIAAGVDDSGNLTQPGDLTLTTTGQLSAHGQNLAGGNINATGNGIDLSSSQTAGISVSLDAQGGPLSTAGATVDARKALTARTTSVFNNDSGSLTAEKLTLSAHDISNRRGTLIQVGEDDLTLNPAGQLDNQGGHIRSNSKNLTLSAMALNNQSGEITHAGKGRLSLSAQQSIDNSAGTVQSVGDIGITSAHINNAGGTLAGAGAASLNATSANNQSGSIGAGGDIQLLLSGALDNRQGKIASSGSLNITGTNLLNQSGILGAGGLFTLKASSLNNQSGKIKAGDSLTFSLNNTLDNSEGGIIGTDGDMHLSSLTLLNNQGQLLSNGNGNIAATVVNNHAGKIAVQSVLDLQADTLKNDRGGLLQSGGDMAITVKNISNTGTVDEGGISTNGNLNITSSSLDNTAGLLLAGQRLSLLNSLLTNQSGQVVAQGAVSLSTTSDLNNQNGLVQGNGVTLDMQGHALNNQSGTLYSLAALKLNAADVNNQGGTLGAGSNSTVTANALDNRNGGRIVAQQNAHLNTQSLQNQQGQIQSAGDLWLKIVTLLNNQNGLLRSGATTTLVAQQLDNSTTQGDNKGIEGQTVNITSDRLNNQSGSLLANDSMKLTIAGQLDNSDGLMSAGKMLAMEGTALQLTNTNGTASAGSLLSLNALNLTGDGQLLSTGDMSVNSQQGFSNQGTLIANHNLSLTTSGDLINSGQLLAGNILNVHGRSLSNQQSGEINGGTDRLYFTDSITNYGLIDGGLTWLESRTLNNTGTGRIYGDSVGVNVTTFNNMVADGVAPVLAGRAQVNVGAQTINNYEHALIYSDGTLAVGGALAVDGTVTGRADTINNHSATLESAGDMLLNVNKLNNINDHFATEVVTVSVIDKLLYQWKGTMYDTVDYNIHLDKIETWIICIEGVTCRSTNNGDNFNEYRYTETTQETQVKESDPAKILAGGNLTINADSVYNENSQIVAGGTLAVNAATVDNEQAEGQRIITDNGTLKHYWRDSHKGGDSPGIDTSKYTPPAIIQTISLNPGRMDGNSSFSGSGENIDAQGNRNTDVNTGGAGSADTGVNGSDKTPVAPQPGTQFDVTPEGGDGSTVIRTVTPDTRLPDNSLFNVITDNNSSYLIQTDPRFTSNKKWLGSDYMQDRLGIDQTMKRLGDGYYEQRLVREQIIALSGMRYLDGFSNDEDEYKALMDNGLAFNDQYQLSPCVALTAEQMAKLTKPIVWLVNTTIAMPDGSRQTVLVPQVYAPVKAGDLNASGALMSGGNIAMNLTGDLNNSGVIGGRKATVITAENILNNAGSIQGADVSLSARNDITSIGGTLQGLDSLVANAGRDINITTTTRSTSSSNTTSQFSRTTLDKVASIAVLNDNSTLVINAGRDANLTAAQVVNAGNESQMLIAAGRNVNLNTVTTASQDNVAWDKDNTLHQANSNEIGTQIASNGSVSLAAGQDINARAVSINASDALALAAGHDINIVSGTNHDEVDESHKKNVNGGLLSHSTVATRDAFSRDTAAASTLSANTITVKAGHDILVRGSDAAATGDIAMQAGRNLTITSAEETSREWHMKKTTKSGLLSSGGMGFTVGTLKETTENDSQVRGNRQSMVGSLQGDTLLLAGNDYRQTGSTVSAPAGNVLIQGKNVTIEAAQNTWDSQYRHTVEQSGFTLAVNVPALQALQVAASAVKKVGKSGDDRINMLAAANAAWDSAGAANTMMDGAKAVMENGAQGAAQNVSVSLTYGKSKQTNTETINSTTAQASKINAGKNAVIVATGGEHSDINIIGSDIAGKQGTTLFADNDINIVAAKQERHDHTDDHSSGWNAGVAVSYGQSGAAFGVTAGGQYGVGNGQGDEVTWRNSHVGDAGGLTSITSGGDTTLRGGQIMGQGVQITADNLNIESLQDTMKYQGKQMDMSGQVTMGYGFSASGSFNMAEVNADYASVQEQSGIFAGDNGYQINVNNHTDLKGGIITSNDIAERMGKNQLSTGTLTASDIENHSEFEGKGVGLSGGISVASNGENGNNSGKTLVGKNMSGGIGYDHGSEGSVTHSGINTGNIVITRADEQQALTGKTVAETIDAIRTDVSTETAAANSGKLDNNFDKDGVFKELHLQVSVTKEFRDNANKQIDSYIDSKQASARADLKKAMDENDPVARDKALDEIYKLQYQKRFLETLVGVVAGTPGVAITQGTLATAATAMREESVKNSFIFKGAVDKDGRVISNVSGESDGLYDGIKIGGVRVGLDFVCGKGNGRCKKDINGNLVFDAQGHVQYTGDDKHPTFDSLLADKNMSGGLYGPTGGFQGGAGSMGPIPYNPGSFFDDLVESYAGTHDLIGGQLPGFYDNTGNTARGRSELENIAANTWTVAAIPIATPFAMSELVSPELLQFIFSAGK